MKVFKGALIGCGFFSQNHQEAWRRILNAEIVAASDLSLERAQAAAPRAYTSAKELLQAEVLDFVDIATRSPTHMELVSLAAEKGLAIICQKPMAPDWETARRMVEVCEKNRVRAMIHDNWRWQSWYRAAAGMIAQGDIGTPLGYGFRCRVKEGTGPEPYPRQAYFRQLPRFMIDEVLVHHIDTARFLFGDIASIYAEGARRNPHVRAEDHVILTLRHVGGAMGSIEGSSFLSHLDSARTLDEATFEGESGSLMVNGQGEIWSGEQKLWRDFGKGYRGDSVFSTQSHFIDCLETGRPFETGFRDYLEHTFAAVEAAYMSLESHCSVEIAKVLGAAP
ncbi:MAG TPA: Gfo/Idh/MocA family oxidoreductase [Acidobacteriaceae bacterium]|nr:Gfo/Idh/MocA family oxidoreductase [Acidobacteriaceae bacterium]